MRWTFGWDDLPPGSPRGAARPGGRPARGRGPAARRLSVEALEELTVPGFLAPIQYAVGSKPGAVATGDFNGDGKPDLVTANGNSSNVSVLLNTGGGTFQAARHYATGPSPNSVAVGDFNAD